MNELKRLMSQMISLGKIEELDTDAKKVKVKFSDQELISDWLPWPADYGKNYIRWKPLRLQSDVILLAPSGDRSRTLIVGMVFGSEVVPGTNDDELDQIEFSDGTKIQYSTKDKKLSIECEGDVSVTAKGGAKVTAKDNVEVVCDGDAVVEAKGTMTVKGLKVVMNDETGGGVVCQNHLCSFTGSPHPQASTTVFAKA